MSEIVRNIINGLVMSSACWIFLCTIYNKKLNHDYKKLSLLLLFMTTLYAVVASMFTGFIKTVLILVYHIVIIKQSCNVSWSKSMLISIGWQGMVIIPEMLAMLILVYAFGLTEEYCRTYLAGAILVNIWINIGAILLTYIMRKFLRKIENYKIEIDKQIILYTFLTFFSVIILFYYGFSSFQFNYITLLIFCTIIFFIVILISLMRQRTVNRNLTVAYDSLINFVTTYETIIDDQRIYNHENKNQLITIKSKLTDNERNNKIINYIDSVLDEKVGLDKEQYCKLGYLPSNGLKGMFYYKIAEAEKNDVKVEIILSRDIKDSVVSKLNSEDYKQLCRLIGVYLDNAIEAAVISKDKLIGIEILMKTPDVHIIISNSYQTVDIENLKSNEMHTTKGAGRGYGLKLAKNIINFNQNFESNKQVTNKLYIQTIVIKGNK